MPDNATDITNRLTKVRERIAAAESRYGREPGSVGLIAVSKTRPVGDILAAAAAGQRRFGESYAQEALSKITATAGQGLAWHFIGPLQANKTKIVAENFAWVHSLDREKSARRLNDRRPTGLGPLQVCLQVNISGEASKSGVAPDNLAALAAAVAALPNLQLRGLMAIPAPATDIERQRASCRRLRDLFETLRAQGYSLDTLSMGMSDDLEAAVAEGATLVRIGTAIFGARG
jgi:pyridoxal phosphate enzyme (YggS family)